MITNILLGLILGTITGVFLVLNSKINILQDYLGTIIRKLNSIDSVIDGINISNCNLLDRFNNFVLRYNELNGLLETKVNYNIEYFDKKLNDITNLIYEVNEHISVQHNNARYEINKKAKINSKKKQTSRQSKSINKQ